MASVAAGRDEEAFKRYPATAEASRRAAEGAPWPVCPRGGSGWKRSPAPPPAPGGFPSVAPDSPFTLRPRRRQRQRGTRRLCRPTLREPGRTCPGNLPGQLPSVPPTPSGDKRRRRGTGPPRTQSRAAGRDNQRGRSGKLTASWPFASGLIYLPPQRRLVLSPGERGRSRGSARRRSPRHSCNSHGSGSSSLPPALIYLCRP